MTFDIELTGNRYQPRQVTFLHLITGFALTGIGAFTFLLADTDWIRTVFHKPFLPANLLGTISLAYGLLVLFLTFFRNVWLQQPKNSKLMRTIHFITGMVLTIIFLLSQWWLAGGIAGVVALANLFALFYEQKASAALTVHFSEQAILLPATSRRKQLVWTEVERVLLRHGTVTIDCTNNFLYQWNYKDTGIDVWLFEEFCKAQIENNRSKRDTNDW